MEDDGAPGNERVFNSSLTGLIAYLQQQQSLIAEMKTTCRTLSNTGCESMSKVSSWFKKHWVRIQLYLVEKNPVCTPTPKWWIVMLFIDLVSTAATITYRSLQGLITTESQQNQGLTKLSQLLINLVNASPSLEGTEVNEEMIVVSTNWTYSVALVHMIGTLNDLGTFAMEIIESIGAQWYQPLCYNLSKCMVNLINGIEAMTAERDSSNEATERVLSPVLPHKLVK